MTQEPTTTRQLDNAPHERARRWEWFAEKCGRGLIAIVLIAALAGGLGPGQLSHRVTTSADGQLSAEHDTIQRYQAPAKLQITCRAPPTDADVIRLQISRSFTDRVAVEQITPEPERMDLADNLLIYRFRTSDLNDAGHILLRFKHDEYGTVRYTVTVNGSKVQLMEYVLP
jgi:hypothetical protein